jgi:quinol monooxygenase YgiN
MSEHNIIVGTATGHGLGVPGVGGLYGLIGKMTAASGRRGALAEILLDATADMPGCLSYVIAEDPAEPDVLWITEVWDSQASHAASLSLPSVQAAIGQARPLIAGMERVTETRPLGGQGL